jgi:hypothetical protein
VTGVGCCAVVPTGIFKALVAANEPEPVTVKLPPTAAFPVTVKIPPTF